MNWNIGFLLAASLGTADAEWLTPYECLSTGSSSRAPVYVTDSIEHSLGLLHSRQCLPDDFDWNNADHVAIDTNQKIARPRSRQEGWRPNVTGFPLRHFISSAWLPGEEFYYPIPASKSELILFYSNRTYITTTV